MMLHTREFAKRTCDPLKVDQVYPNEHDKNQLLALSVCICSMCHVWHPDMYHTNCPKRGKYFMDGTVWGLSQQKCNKWQLSQLMWHYRTLPEANWIYWKSSIHQCPPYTSIEIYVSADKSMINPQFQTGVRNMKKWKKFTWCWLISLNKQQSVTKNISTHGIHKKPLTRLTGTSDKERPVFCWDPT